MLDQDGNVRAMVELDYLLPYFKRDLNQFVQRILIIFVILIFGILLTLLIYLEHNVLVPIGLLNKSEKWGKTLRHMKCSVMFG